MLTYYSLHKKKSSKHWPCLLFSPMGQLLLYMNCMAALLLLTTIAAIQHRRREEKKRDVRGCIGRAKGCEMVTEEEWKKRDAEESERGGEKLCLGGVGVKRQQLYSPSTEKTVYIKTHACFPSVVWIQSLYF